MLNPGNIDWFYLFKKRVHFGYYCSLKNSKSIDITRKQLDLKTSVSARAPWVRIPPPPFSKTDFNKNFSLRSFFISHYFRSLFTEFRVIRWRKVAQIRHNENRKISQHPISLQYSEVGIFFKWILKVLWH